MKLKLIAAFLIAAVFSQSITTCQQQNYLGVIGGSSYTVNSVYTAINSIQSTIAVGGLLTQTATSIPIAFFYLFQSKTCQLVIQNQFTAYTSGIQAISFSPDNNQVAMVAYSANAEFLIVVETTSATYETWIYQTGTQSDVVRTLSLLCVGYDQYFVVGTQKIRKVFGSESQAGSVYSSLDFNAPTIKCATNTSFAIYALLQKDGSPSIILTKLDLQLNELNSYSTINGVSTTWADNDARISNAVGPPTSTAVAVCVHGLTEKVQFTMYVSDDTTHAVTLSTTYKTSSWAQCLGVRVKDGSIADYVLIDAALTIWWYSINFDTGILQSRQTLTPTLVGWQNSRRSSAVLGQGFTLIPGLVSQILGISKGYVLGFVRINQDVQWSTSVSPQFLLNILVTDPTPVLGQGLTVTETFTSTTVNLKQILAPTVQKSDWTKDFCPDIQNVQLGTSSCLYYSVYDNPQAVSLLDTSRAGVPKEAGLCPQTSSDQLDVSLALSPIRQVCFPFLNKSPKSIPYDNAAGKYLVQQNGAFWNWPRSIQKALAKKSASIVHQTDTDDKLNFPGDRFSIKFSGQLVANQVIKITRGKNFKLGVVTPSKSMKNKQFTFQISCLSRTCPGKLLILNDTVAADSSDICGSELNKAYIYMVEIHYTAQNFSEFSTFTFNFTCPKQKSPININLPWAEWVELNGKSSKYRPTPLTQNQEVAAEQEISSTDYASLLSDASPEAQRVESKWTNEQVFSAVAEAIARKDKIAKQILFSAKMGNQGNLRLSFSNPVAMPSYLIFDSKQELIIIQENQNQTSPKDATANSRRRRRMKCAGGACPQLSPEDPAVTQALDCSDDDCSAPDCQGNDCQTPKQVDESLAVEDQAAIDEVVLAFQQQNQAALDDIEQAEQADNDAETGSNEQQDVPDAVGSSQTAPVAVESSECTSQVETGGDNTCTQDLNLEAPILDSLDCGLPENFNAVLCGGSDPLICPFGSYFDNLLNTCKKFVLYFGEWKDLIRIVVLPDLNRDQATALEELAHTYIVTAATVNYIDIQIYFVNPLKVTVRDKVQFELKFNEIEPALPGVSGSRRLVANSGLTLFTTQLTPQLPIGGAKNLQTAAVSVQAATIGAVVGSAVLQILLSGALAQIWGMINGIQIIIYLPLLAIQFPANALMIIDKILIVACFDIPYLNMEDIYGDLWEAGDDVSIFNDLPDNELVTSGMNALGFSSRMLSANLGSVFIFMTLSFGLLGFIGILELLQRSGKFETFRKINKLEHNSLTLAQLEANLPAAAQPIKDSIVSPPLELMAHQIVCDDKENHIPIALPTTNTSVTVQPILVQPILSSQKSQRKLKKQNRGYRLLKWMQNKFLWNYFIRLFFECCLELIIATWLGVKYGNFWTPETSVPTTAATVICFGLSLWWFIVVAGLPIFFMSFYLYNWNKVKDEAFESKFGCVYEGLKTESKMALVYPNFFVVRRCCFLITAIVGYQFIWMQIVVQLFFCFFIILFVYMTWPFEDDTQNKLEIMNEVTTVLLMYIIFMFSDLIPDPEIQYMVGYFFIVILISNLSVHLTLIGSQIFQDLRDKIKKWHKACTKKQKGKKKKENSIVQVEDLQNTRNLQEEAKSKKNPGEPMTEMEPEAENASSISEEEKSAVDSDLETQQTKKRVEEIKGSILKQEDRNFRYLQRQLKTDESFDASQGMCCNRFRNRKGVRAIIIIDMICCLNLIRFVFAVKAFKNMEDQFTTYAKVRLVTFWMQAIWLTLNLGVCIFINVWGGSTLDSVVIFVAILVVIIVTAIDFHFMQCVLFLNNHMERLNYKAADDDVRYAYQMDPTAPENIEEQQEELKRKSEEQHIKAEGEAVDERAMQNQKHKKASHRDKIVKRDLGDFRGEPKKNPVVFYEGNDTDRSQSQINIPIMAPSILVSEEQSDLSYSQDSESDHSYGSESKPSSEKIQYQSQSSINPLKKIQENNKIIADQSKNHLLAPQQDKPTFQLAKCSTTRLQNDTVIDEMMSEMQLATDYNLTENMSSVLLFPKIEPDNSNEIQQGMFERFIQHNIKQARNFNSGFYSKQQIFEETKENPRSRKAILNQIIPNWKDSNDPATRKVASRINFNDLEDLLPDDFTDESDGYQESAVSNLLAMLSEKEEVYKQGRMTSDIQLYPTKKIGTQKDLPSGRPIPSPKFLELRKNIMINLEENRDIDSQNMQYKSFLDNSDSENAPKTKFEIKQKQIALPKMEIQEKTARKNEQIEGEKLKLKPGWI